MEAWAWRMERRSDDAKMLAYNTGALAGMAFNGKLKPYKQIFPNERMLKPEEQEEMTRTFKNAKAQLKNRVIPLPQREQGKQKHGG